MFEVTASGFLLSFWPGVARTRGQKNSSNHAGNCPIILAAETSELEQVIPHY
jgi:hypothetical protein